MSKVYVIHERIIARTDHERDLLEYGVFGSLDSAYKLIYELAEEAKTELCACEGVHYEIKIEKTVTYDIISIEPIMSELYCDCEDYTEERQFYAKSIDYFD